MLNVVNEQAWLANDIEVKQTGSGKMVTSFGLKQPKPYGRDGYNYFNCVAWGKTADYIAKNFKKGDMIAVNGYLDTREYDDRNGNHRTATEIVVEQAHVCESKKPASAPAASDDGLKEIFIPEAAPRREMSEEERIMYEDEHLPF